MATRVTLRDVATAAQVSISTASLALAGASRVAAATAERVRSQASRLGYVRDPFLAGIASKRFRHVGKPVVVGVCFDHLTWQARLEDQARSMGMAIRKVPWRDASNPARLRDTGVAALIVYRRGVDTHVFAEHPVPVLLWLIEGQAAPLVDHVSTCEWWSATIGAGERMRAAGFPRFVVVLHQATPRHWHDDVRLAASRTLGVPVLEWDYRDASLDRFLRKHRPEAVLGFMPVVDGAMQRMGHHLPFAALLQIDSPYFARYDGWMPDYEHSIRVSLETIEQRLRYGPRAARQIIIPPVWLTRGSLSER